MGISARLVESVGQCGGGSLPGAELRSVAVEILSPAGKKNAKLTFAEKLFGDLLRGELPVLGILREGRILLDVLAVFEDEIPRIAKAVSGSLRREE